MSLSGIADVIWSIFLQEKKNQSYSMGYISSKHLECVLINTQQAKTTVKSNPN